MCKIRQLRKGGVVGVSEASANESLEEIDVSSRTARLMRFGTRDLERLSKRYPRTAVTVYRNLSRIQGERCAALLEWAAQQKTAPEHLSSTST